MLILSSFVVVVVAFEVGASDYEQSFWLTVAVSVLITLRIFQCARAFEMMYVTKNQQAMFVIYRK